MFQLLLYILIVMVVILRLIGLIQFGREKYGSFTMNFLPMRHQTLKVIRKDPESVSQKVNHFMIIGSVVDLIIGGIFLYVIFENNIMMVIFIAMVFVVSDNIIRGKIDQEINR